MGSYPIKGLYLLPLEQIERLILFCPNETELGLSKSNPSDKILQVSSWEEVGLFLGL